MLVESAYGKSRIRLVQVRRRGTRHALIDLTIAIRFDGDYGPSYTDGDNTDVLPTDTMKNTVYALAARETIAEPEAFGLVLGRHFLAGNPRLVSVRIDLTDHAWRPMVVGGRDHGQAFVRRGPDARTATVQCARDKTMVGAGISDLVILKSGHSAFAGYRRDEFTTLRETTDRLLATALTATWHYAEDDLPFGTIYESVRQTLLETFADHDSQSVQHTLYAMGQAVLDTNEEVTAIRLVMPNRHHLPVDLTPFGLVNRNEIFVATEEPHGLIEATLAR
jgi:urate oxidase